MRKFVISFFISVFFITTLSVAKPPTVEELQAIKAKILLNPVPRTRAVRFQDVFDQNSECFLDDIMDASNAKHSRIIQEAGSAGKDIRQYRIRRICTNSSIHLMCIKNRFTIWDFPQLANFTTDVLKELQGMCTKVKLKDIWNPIDPILKKLRLLLDIQLEIADRQGSELKFKLKFD